MPEVTLLGGSQDGKVIKPGTKVEITGPRPPWASGRKARGEIVQVTDYLYVIRLEQGFCECFIRCDPNVSIRVLS